MLTFQKSDWFIHSKSFNWSLNEVVWKKESKLLTLNALIGSRKSPGGVWVLWMKGWVAPCSFQFPHLCWFCACDDVCTPLYFCMRVPKYVQPKEPAGRKLHGILNVLSSFSSHPSQTWNSLSWGGLGSASNTERVMEVTSAGCSVLISSLLTASSKQPDRIQNSSPKMSLLSFNTDHSTTKVGLTFPNNRTARYPQPMHLVHSHSHNTTLSRRFMNVRCLKGLL